MKRKRHRSQPADVVLRALPVETECRFTAACVRRSYRVVPAIALVAIAAGVFLGCFVVLGVLGVVLLSVFAGASPSSLPGVAIAFLLSIPVALLVSPAVYDAVSRRAITAAVVDEGTSVRVLWCPDCAYDLSGTRAARCPECGGPAVFEQRTGPRIDEPVSR